MFDSMIMKSAVALSLIASLSAGASAASPLPKMSTPYGAWASGAEVSACETAPITYFSSDGVVLVLLGKDGPIHSFGSWSIKSDVMEMTHNDFPLDVTGQSKPVVKLDILELNKDSFTTRNVRGDVRERTKCANIEINPTPDHSPHK